jgi:DNA ligase-1
MKRYFELVDAKSSKFWEVWIEGTTMFTRFGKIGVNGQTTIKEFPDADAAQKALEKAAAEKTKKGYVGGSSNV